MALWITRLHEQGVKVTALAVTQDQAFWDEKQIAVLNQLGLQEASKADLALFLSYAQRTGLDPFSRQIYMIGRFDGRSGGKRFTIQASIDGLRIVAQRSGEYAGQTEPMWCGADGVWTDVWLSSEAPAAAKVGVYRQGFVEPLVAVARYESYCPRDKNGNPSGLWKQMPDVMLAKVAEALALRKAFPNDLSGLYAAEEMDQADKPKSQAQEQPQPMKRVAIAVEREPSDEAVLAARELVDEIDQAVSEDVLMVIWEKAKTLEVVDVPVEDPKSEGMVTVREVLRLKVADVRAAKQEEAS